ncbi:hypothetical protein NQZ68_015604 [Dissostichus eleginoides]|nr:hypothetical protein NQZ68_015604 [Dissostichus eleginoides]
MSPCGVQVYFKGSKTLQVVQVTSSARSTQPAYAGDKDQQSRGMWTGVWDRDKRNTKHLHGFEDMWQ